MNLIFYVPKENILDISRKYYSAYELYIKKLKKKYIEVKNICCLVKDNNKEFEALWEMINTDLLDTGKVIYKEINKEKVKDYTYSVLIKKIRLARKKETEATPVLAEATT